MANRLDFGSVNLRAGEDAGLAQPTSETPFCVAILGDFTGRSSRGLCEPATISQRRAFVVDRDNFDEVLSRLQVELHLATESKSALVFRFSELEDFHPDHLIEHEAFQQLKGLRDQLADPATFAQVAEKFGLIREPADNSVKAEGNRRVSPPEPVRLASGSLLDNLVDQTEARMALEPPRSTDEVREFARQLAAKHAVSAPDRRQPEIVAAVDRAIGDAMRGILHHPSFQALEAIWRATFFLVRQLETGSNLSISLIDLSKEELAKDLGSAQNPRESSLYRLLVERTVGTAGANPWSVIVGNFRFGTSSDDMEQLAGLAKIAGRAGAPFVAQADSMLVGSSSLSSEPHPRDWDSTSLRDAWKTLRSQPDAAWVGLALPRFLLRLPYGSQTSPLESVDFEEFAGAPSHPGYLWGNPAVAIAMLLGRSFTAEGWNMRPGSASQIENLPLHIYRESGDTQVKPCAEVLLTDEAVEHILDQGLIPLISFKGRDSVRVGRFQSLAEPQQTLRGRWHGRNSRT